jgi:phosphosulfolactate synthase
LPVESIIFEAPTKTLQTYFIKRIGPNVNLANISFADPIGLETLRLGLRSDTLLAVG